jgi:cytochrome c oxidase cbb3-type subunit 3
MSEQREGKKIEGHEYDGIQELDNSLPRWWINLFYLTILFAVGYYGYYELGHGPSIQKEYRADQEAFDYARDRDRKAVTYVGEAELRKYAQDSERVRAGNAIFQAKCASCHGDHAQGGIGPNLTDEYWLHGGTMTAILNTVAQGVLDKGMPPWGAVLKTDELSAAGVVELQVVCG